MAFTGTPIVQMITDGLVRVTGLSLVDGANGTIGLFENSGSPGVRLPQAFQPHAYSRTSPADDVTLQDCIEVELTYEQPDGEALVGVVKSGTTSQDFLITFDGQGSIESTSGPLEIYIRYH